MSLPNQLDYSQAISELPECTNYEVTLVPSTGAGSYEPGSVIKFDFQNTNGKESCEQSSA